VVLVAAPESGLPVIEQDSRAVGDDLTGEGGGGDAGGKPGAGTEGAQESETSRLTGLLDGGIDER
jgi:hypothetical protein